MAKLTVEVDADLRRRLKIEAANRHTTVSALLRKWIERGLREGPPGSGRPKAPPPLPQPNGRRH